MSALRAPRTRESFPHATFGVLHVWEAELLRNCAWRELHVENLRVAPNVARELARSAALTALHIANNPLGDAGGVALAAAPALRVLDVSCTGMGCAGFQALAAGCPALEALRGALNPVGPLGAAALGRARAPLVLLELQHTGIGEAGAAALLRSTSLRHLDITGCGVWELRDDLRAALDTNFVLQELRHAEAPLRRPYAGLLREMVRGRALVLAGRAVVRRVALASPAAHGCGVAWVPRAPLWVLCTVAAALRGEGAELESCL